MFVSETAIRVRYAETDQMGVVYHANYFTWFEVARVESLRSLGLRYSDLEKSGTHMPIVDVQCRYLRPALYDELLSVKTILKELPVHHKIEFHHEVYNEKMELVATGKVILYFMDSATMKRRNIPEQMREKLQPYFG